MRRVKVISSKAYLKVYLSNKFKAILSPALSWKAITQSKNILFPQNWQITANLSWNTAKFPITTLQVPILTKVPLHLVVYLLLHLLFTPLPSRLQHLSTLPFTRVDVRILGHPFTTDLTHTSMNVAILFLTIPLPSFLGPKGGKKLLSRCWVHFPGFRHCEGEVGTKWWWRWKWSQEGRQRWAWRGERWNEENEGDIGVGHVCDQVINENKVPNYFLEDRRFTFVDSYLTLHLRTFHKHLTSINYTQQWLSNTLLFHLSSLVSLNLYILACQFPSLWVRFAFHLLLRNLPFKYIIPIFNLAT